jgi:hypothetical protein
MENQYDVYPLLEPSCSSIQPRLIPKADLGHIIQSELSASMGRFKG